MNSTPTTDFQAAAASAALVRMFTEKYFNICKLDAIAATIGRKQHLAGRDYEALRALHCMDWADMGTDLAHQTRAVCCQILGIPESHAGVTEPPAAHPMKAKEARSRFSLIFNRSGA